MRAISSGFILNFTLKLFINLHGVSLDLFRVAARVAVADKCPVCKTLMLYDDGRDAYVCNCGFVDANGSAGSDDLEEIATIIASAPSVMNCTTEFSISVNFEGSVSNPSLVKKLESEFLAAIESAIQITAREMQLKATELKIKPLSVEIATQTNKS